MDRLIIHAGTHKTGTSALQVFCSNRPDLLKLGGVYYPLAGRPSEKSISFGHHLLPWSLTGYRKEHCIWHQKSASADLVWGELLEEAEKCSMPNVLISSEEFDTLGSDHLDHIREVFKDIKVNVIIYFRRLDEFIEGMYGTDVVYGRENQAITSYIKALRVCRDYACIVHRWRMAFGEDSVVVRPYWRPNLVGGSIIRDFFDSANLAVPLSKDDDMQGVNPGLPWYVVEAVRWLNILEASEENIDRLVRIWRTASPEHNRDYDILAPSTRMQMIAHNMSFFKEVCAMECSSEIWNHFSGNDISETDEEWVDRHGDKETFFAMLLHDLERIYR